MSSYGFLTIDTNGDSYVSLPKCAPKNPPNLRTNQGAADQGAAGDSGVARTHRPRRGSRRRRNAHQPSHVPSR